MTELSYKNVNKRVAFMEGLTKSESVKLERFMMPLKAKKNYIDDAKKRSFPNSIIAFYEQMDGLYIKWVSKKIKDSSVRGVVNIMPLQEVLKSWENVVYFDKDDSMVNFVPIDFFEDEACVGAFIGENKSESLYFYRFRPEPINLKITLPAYYELVLNSKGFIYWQYAIIAEIEKKENPMSDIFKENMPKLFSEFDYDEFIALYNSLKMK